MSIPRIMIAGTGSGVGKTTLSVGLAAALTRRGMRVQTFKVGPDYLDPAWLSEASGRPCYNLDGWICGRPYVEKLFARTTRGMDIALIEGVMGLFDGASAAHSRGSSAEIARWLKTPVILLVNAHGMARSIAPLVAGFSGFEAGVCVQGVIANRVGSTRHLSLLRDALGHGHLPPLLGGLPKGGIPELSSRHLGLRAPDAGETLPVLDAIAAQVEAHVDINGLLDAAKSAAALSLPASPEGRPASASLTLAVAKDDAFHFYYPDLFDELKTRGWRILFFSPLSDTVLPEDADALYLGGGYPELFGEALSRNHAMHQAIREFSASKRPIYAECGGLMYLSGAVNIKETRHPLLGILPVETRMKDRRSRLGYVETVLRDDSLWGKAGESLRGHEFHYSEIPAEIGAVEGWRRAYDVTYRSGSTRSLEGFWNPDSRILASYVHLHPASSPEALDHFTELCTGVRQRAFPERGGENT